MIKTISFKTSKESWKLQKRLQQEGYEKVSDCYWAIIFEKDGETIILKRE